MSERTLPLGPLGGAALVAVIAVGLVVYSIFIPDGESLSGPGGPDS